MKDLDAIRCEDGTLPYYAWPGGYPMFYIDSDNAPICAKCAQAFDRGEYSTELIAYDVNWEDPSLWCDNCSERIQSAYAEEEATAD